MRALVVGACGFVGRHLCRYLESSGDEVIGTVFSESSGLTCETLSLDITDQIRCAELIRDCKPEVIYNLAGISFVPEAENDFSKTLQVNVGGPHNIFRAAHLLQADVTVVLISSAEVYGKILPNDLPLTEETPCRPANNYSLSKLMSEHVVNRYVQFGAVKGVIMRPFNHIGIGQDERFVVSSFASQLAAIAKGKSKPVIRVGNLEARRDFCDVRDVVRAYRLAAEKREGLYNVSSGRSYRIADLLQWLMNISELEVKIEQDPARMRPSEVPEIRGSYERARTELGWEPEFDIRNTLEEIYRSYL